MATLKLIFEAIRDLLFGFLPRRVVDHVIEKGEYAFLVHPLGPEDATRKYPFAKNISERIFELWARYYWTVIGSPITGFKNSGGKQIKGWVVICPFTPKQMLKNPALARKKILRAAQFAEKIGAKIIGLGGFNSILTRDGQYLIGKVNAGITTGNAYAAALIIQNIYRIAEEVGIDLKRAKIAIVGAAGSVGSACSKILLRHIGECLLVDIDRRALETLSFELKGYNNFKVTTRIGDIDKADLVVAVTNTPGAVVTTEYLKPGTIVIDAAQPKNVSEEVPKQRKDVLVIDSGIAKVPGVKCDLDLGPREGEVYACLGEILILTWKGFTENYALGKTDPLLVEEVSNLAENAGLLLAPFRNSLGPITEEDIARIRKYRKERA